MKRLGKKRGSGKMAMVMVVRISVKGERKKTDGGARNAKLSNGEEAAEVAGSESTSNAVKDSFDKEVGNFIVGANQNHKFDGSSDTYAFFLWFSHSVDNQRRGIPEIRSEPSKVADTGVVKGWSKGWHGNGHQGFE